MGASSGPRLSGMQRQVLSLYRGFVRAARLKSAEDRHKIESLVSNEFRCNAKIVDRKNFLYIEYLLRRGKKQLDQLKSPDTVGLSALNSSAGKEIFDLNPYLGILNCAILMATVLQGNVY